MKMKNILAALLRRLRDPRVDWFSIAGLLVWLALGVVAVVLDI